MKHIKIYENLEEERSLFTKFKKLFFELFDDLLNLRNLEISGVQGDYEVYFKLGGIINNRTFEKFNDFFSFLNKLNVEFKLDEIHFYLTISNLEEVIEEMTIRSQSNKYNL